MAAGLRPMDAVVAATSRAADRLGLDDTGRLTPGARADFIVLDANPLDDVANSQRIVDVYLGGTAVDRAGLRAGWAAP